MCCFFFSHFFEIRRTAMRFQPIPWQMDINRTKIICQFLITIRFYSMCFTCDDRFMGQHVKMHSRNRASESCVKRSACRLMPCSQARTIPISTITSIWVKWNLEWYGGAFGSFVHIYFLSIRECKNRNCKYFILEHAFCHGFGWKSHTPSQTKPKFSTQSMLICIIIQV